SYLPFSIKEARELEERANQIIFENRPIHHYYAEENNKLTTKELRKCQELSGKLRIIEIEKYDLTACGGTHCHNTGEVGIIKITGWEKRKDKVRISFLCGYRALADYQKKSQITKNLSNILTTGSEQLEERILQLTSEQKNLKKQYSKIEKRVLCFEVEKLKKNNGIKKDNLFMVSKLFTEKTLQSLQQMSSMLANQQNSLTILGTTRPEPAICLACSRDLSINPGELVKQIIIEYNGKGGGSDFMAIGKFKKSDDAKKAFDRVTNIFF
ncbi:MAG: DHHA1 domain-containing protein, partial [Atribacterota bacterium]